MPNLHAINKIKAPRKIRLHYFTLTHITGNAADAIQVQCGHKSRTACSELLFLSKFKATSAYTAVQ